MSAPSDQHVPALPAITLVAPDHGGLRLFDFEGAAVRLTTGPDGEPWFVASDAIACLGYGPTRISELLDDLDDDEKGYADVVTPGGRQRMRIVSEPALYKLIARSHKPSARRFDRKIRHEILPTIRKSGSYGVPDVRDPAQLAAIALQLIEVTRELQAENHELQATIEAAQPKVGFYDRFANAEGLYTLQNAGRVLGQKPNKFIDLLKREYLFYQGASLVPKARYREMRLFDVKPTIINDVARQQTYVTAKGIQHFSTKLGLDQLPLGDRPDLLGRGA